MSNINRIKEDILDIIYLENLYISKEEVLGAYDDFIELLKNHSEYDEEYTTIAKQLRAETEAMEFAQIQDIMNSVNDDSDEMFVKMSDPDYEGSVYLYDEFLEKTEFLKLGNVSLEGTDYCIMTLADKSVTDIEENEASAFRLDPTSQEAEYVEDKELNQKIFAAFNQK